MFSSGLDISELKFRLVKINKTGSKVSIKKMKELDVEPGIIKDGIIVEKEKAIKLLKRLRKENGEKEIIACLPEKQSFIKVITASEENLLNEFAKHLPFSITEVYLDKHKLDDNEYIVGACRKELIENYIEILRKSGFMPLKLEIEAETLTRILPLAESSLLIDIGHARTTFVVTRNEIVHFTTSFPSVIGQSDSKIMLKQEISQLLLFCGEHLEKEDYPQEIVLCGSGATEENLKIISELSNIKTRHGDFNKFLKKNVKLPLVYATAFGLALGKFYA